MGTEWEAKVNPEWVWRKTRSLHPEILNPVQAKNHEDRRVDWLSYANINLWTDTAKKYLIGIGMLKDEPGEICKFVLRVFQNHNILTSTFHVNYHRRSAFRGITHPSGRCRLVCDA